MENSDPPIIIVGGPQMINVELSGSANNTQPGKFSIEPPDPKMPFKEIIVSDGAIEKFRWPLSENWKIEIK